MTISGRGCLRFPRDRPERLFVAMKGEATDGISSSTRPSPPAPPALSEESLIRARRHTTKALNDLGRASRRLHQRPDHQVTARSQDRHQGGAPCGARPSRAGRVSSVKSCNNHTGVPLSRSHAPRNPFRRVRDEDEHKGNWPAGPAGPPPCHIVTAIAPRTEYFAARPISTPGKFSRPGAGRHPPSRPLTARIATGSPPRRGMRRGC